MAKKEYHETGDGRLIEIKHLTDEHLVNIISMIERKARDGVEVIFGGGHGDYTEMWCDVEYLDGEDVLDYFDYNKYKKEQQRRKRLSNAALQQAVVSPRSFSSNIR